ncbi:hypothetical protein BESB_039010 [Besnoitia besnoiti]|uniref:Uncharacterized protein n=1 Tax=Besnoitia besnoiti TaxID=94643 RepID=A0A2A9MNG6_BESBE|nr:hypothetical protein BESB_039010 [Besnoitia besnoiti]PFH37443.1 hypothetical protein BESB_039010 [Besnoitia besnoiti]
MQGSRGCGASFGSSQEEGSEGGGTSSSLRALQHLLRSTSSSQPTVSVDSQSQSHNDSQSFASPSVFLSASHPASGSRSPFSQPFSFSSSFAVSVLACPSCGASSRSFCLDDSGHYVCGECGVEQQGVRTLERDEHDVCMDFFGGGGAGVDGEGSAPAGSFRFTRACATAAGGVGEAIRALAESQREADEKRRREDDLATHLGESGASQDFFFSQEAQEAQVRAELAAVAEEGRRGDERARELLREEERLLLLQAKGARATRRGGDDEGAAGEEEDFLLPLFHLCLEEAKGLLGALGEGGGLSAKGHSVGCEREEVLLQAWQTLLLSCCRKLRRFRLPAGLIEREARKASFCPSRLENQAREDRYQFRVMREAEYPDAWSMYLNFLASNKLPVRTFFCNVTKHSFKIPFYRCVSSSLAERRRILNKQREILNHPRLPPAIKAVVALMGLDRPAYVRRVVPFYRGRFFSHSRKFFSLLLPPQARQVTAAPAGHVAGGSRRTECGADDDEDRDQRMNYPLSLPSSTSQISSRPHEADREPCAADPSSWYPASALSLSIATDCAAHLFSSPSAQASPSPFSPSPFSPSPIVVPALSCGGGRGPRETESAAWAAAASSGAAKRDEEEKVSLAPFSVLPLPLPRPRRQAALTNAAGGGGAERASRAAKGRESEPFALKEKRSNARKLVDKGWEGGAWSQAVCAPKCAACVDEQAKAREVGRPASRKRRSASVAVEPAHAEGPAAFLEAFVEQRTELITLNRVAVRRYGKHMDMRVRNPASSRASARNKPIKMKNNAAPIASHMVHRQGFFVQERDDLGDCSALPLWILQLMSVARGLVENPGPSQGVPQLTQSSRAEKRVAYLIDAIYEHDFLALLLRYLAREKENERASLQPPHEASGADTDAPAPRSAPQEDRSQAIGGGEGAEHRPEEKETSVSADVKAALLPLSPSSASGASEVSSGSCGALAQPEPPSSALAVAPSASLPEVSASSVSACISSACVSGASSSSSFSSFSAASPTSSTSLLWISSSALVRKYLSLPFARALLVWAAELTVEQARRRKRRERRDEGDVLDFASRKRRRRQPSNALYAPGSRGLCLAQEGAAVPALVDVNASGVCTPYPAASAAASPGRRRPSRYGSASSTSLLSSSSSSSFASSSSPGRPLPFEATAAAAGFSPSPEALPSSAALSRDPFFLLHAFGGGPEAAACAPPSEAALVAEVVGTVKERRKRKSIGRKGFLSPLALPPHGSRSLTLAQTSPAGSSLAALSPSSAFSPSSASLVSDASSAAHAAAAPLCALDERGVEAEGEEHARERDREGTHLAIVPVGTADVCLFPSAFQTGQHGAPSSASLLHLQGPSDATSLSPVAAAPAAASGLSALAPSVASVARSSPSLVSTRGVWHGRDRLTRGPLCSSSSSLCPSFLLLPPWLSVVTSAQLELLLLPKRESRKSRKNQAGAVGMDGAEGTEAPQKHAKKMGSVRAQIDAELARLERCLLGAAEARDSYSAEPGANGGGREAKSEARGAREPSTKHSTWMVARMQPERRLRALRTNAVRTVFSLLAHHVSKEAVPLEGGRTSLSPPAGDKDPASAMGREKAARASAPSASASSPRPLTASLSAGGLKGGLESVAAPAEADAAEAACRRAQRERQEISALLLASRLFDRSLPDELPAIDFSLLLTILWIAILNCRLPLTAHDVLQFLLTDILPVISLPRYLPPALFASCGLSSAFLLHPSHRLSSFSSSFQVARLPSAAVLHRVATFLTQTVGVYVHPIQPTALLPRLAHGVFSRSGLAGAGSLVAHFARCVLEWVEADEVERRRARARRRARRRRARRRREAAEGARRAEAGAACSSGVKGNAGVPLGETSEAETAGGWARRGSASLASDSFSDSSSCASSSASSWASSSSEHEARRKKKRRLLTDEDAQLADASLSSSSGDEGDLSRQSAKRSSRLLASAAAFGSASLCLSSAPPRETSSSAPRSMASVLGTFCFRRFPAPVAAGAALLLAARLLWPLCCAQPHLAFPPSPASAQARSLNRRRERSPAAPSPVSWSREARVPHNTGHAAVAGEAEFSVFSLLGASLRYDCETDAWTALLCGEAAAQRSAAGARIGDTGDSDTGDGDSGEREEVTRTMGLDGDHAETQPGEAEGQASVLEEGERGDAAGGDRASPEAAAGAGACGNGQLPGPCSQRKQRKATQVEDDDLSTTKHEEGAAWDVAEGEIELLPLLPVVISVRVLRPGGRGRRRTSFRERPPAPTETGRADDAPARQGNENETQGRHCPLVSFKVPCAAVGWRSAGRAALWLLALLVDSFCRLCSELFTPPCPSSAPSGDDCFALPASSLAASDALSRFLAVLSVRGKHPGAESHSPQTRAEASFSSGGSAPRASSGLTAFPPPVMQFLLDAQASVDFHAGLSGLRALSGSWRVAASFARTYVSANGAKVSSPSTTPSRRPSAACVSFSPPSGTGRGRHSDAAFLSGLLHSGDGVTSLDVEAPFALPYACLEPAAGAGSCAGEGVEGEERSRDGNGGKEVRAQGLAQGGDGLAPREDSAREETERALLRHRLLRLLDREHQAQWSLLSSLPTNQQLFSSLVSSSSLPACALDTPGASAAACSSSPLSALLSPSLAHLLQLHPYLDLSQADRRDVRKKLKDFLVNRPRLKTAAATTVAALSCEYEDAETEKEDSDEARPAQGRGGGARRASGTPNGSEEDDEDEEAPQAFRKVRSARPGAADLSRTRTDGGENSTMPFASLAEELERAAGSVAASFGRLVREASEEVDAERERTESEERGSRGAGWRQKRRRRRSTRSPDERDTKGRHGYEVGEAGRCKPLVLLPVCPLAAPFPHADPQTVSSPGPHGEETSWQWLGDPLTPVSADVLRPLSAEICASGCAAPASPSLPELLALRFLAANNVPPPPSWTRLSAPPPSAGVCNSASGARSGALKPSGGAADEEESDDEDEPILAAARAQRRRAAADKTQTAEPSRGVTSAEAAGEPEALAADLAASVAAPSAFQEEGLFTGGARRLPPALDGMGAQEGCLPAAYLVLLYKVAAFLGIHPNELHKCTYTMEHALVLRAYEAEKQQTEGEEKKKRGWEAKGEAALTAGAEEPGLATEEPDARRHRRRTSTKQKNGYADINCIKRVLSMAGSWGQWHQMEYARDEQKKRHEKRERKERQREEWRRREARDRQGTARVEEIHAATLAEVARTEEEEDDAGKRKEEKKKRNAEKQRRKEEKQRRKEEKQRRKEEKQRRKEEKQRRKEEKQRRKEAKREKASGDKGTERDAKHPHEERLPRKA